MSYIPKGCKEFLDKVVLSHPMVHSISKSPCSSIATRTSPNSSIMLEDIAGTGERMRVKLLHVIVDTLKLPDGVL